MATTISAESNQMSYDIQRKSKNNKHLLVLLLGSLGPSTVTLIALA
jgi:hypothetical protein